MARAVVDLGFGGEVSPAAVAAHLGVHPSSVYRNVGGTDALVDAALTLLVREAPWPRTADVERDPALGRRAASDGPWRRLLRGTAHAAYELMTAHPGLTLAAAHHAFVNAALLERFGVVVGDLEGLGWDVRDAAVTVDFVLDLTYDTVRDREQLATRPSAASRQTWSELLDPRLAEVFADAAGAGATAWFDQKLDLALAGIAGVLGHD
ncbi:MAG TPA: hypothetical protein VGE77_02930 [Nocardioides sp.]